MLYSTDRNLTTHAGALSQPADPREIVLGGTVGHGAGYVASD